MALWLNILAILAFYSAKALFRLASSAASNASLRSLSLAVEGIGDILHHHHSLAFLSQSFVLAGKFRCFHEMVFGRIPETEE